MFKINKQKTARRAKKAHGGPQFPTSCLPQANCPSVYYPEVAQYILRLGNQKEKQSVRLVLIRMFTNCIVGTGVPDGP